MRFKAHESFFIRKGWLYKGLRNIKEQPELFSSKNINPSDVLGIGTNMVRSLRYWLQVTGFDNIFFLNLKSCQVICYFIKIQRFINKFRICVCCFR